MKKVTVVQDFEYHGESYSVGDELELVDHVADKLCNRGKTKLYETRIEEREVKENKHESKKYKREKKNRE